MTVIKRHLKKKVIIVLPAYNASKTLLATINEIPQKFRKNLILVDDYSFDDTAKIARSLGLKVFEHKKNKGYGANQKTCYKQALKQSPEVIVMLHPDYQYDASLLQELIRPVLEKRYDVMFGSRIANRKSALAGGMPIHKYYINRLVCFVENIVLGVNFTEHFSGFRAYSPEVLKKLAIEKFSDDFVFDQQMIIAALSWGFKIGEIPISTRYHDKASSIKLFKGAKFIVETFWFILLYKLHNWGIIRSGLYRQNK